MAWRSGANSALGYPDPNATQPDTTAKATPGTIASFIEDTLGPAILLYTVGVAGLIAGDVVYYDMLPGNPTTVRVSASNAHSGRALAVAINAPQAGQYGWFQITGVAIVNVLAGAVLGPAFASATAGSLTSTAGAGGQIDGMSLSSGVGTPSAGKAYASINYPTMQTQVVLDDPASDGTQRTGELRPPTDEEVRSAEEVQRQREADDRQIAEDKKKPKNDLLADEKQKADKQKSDASTSSNFNKKDNPGGKDEPETDSTPYTGKPDDGRARKAEKPVV